VAELDVADDIPALEEEEDDSKFEKLEAAEALKLVPELEEEVLVLT